MSRLSKMYSVVLIGLVSLEVHWKYILIIDFGICVFLTNYIEQSPS
jgi:hypothetical protein